jgi:hypothetical protein
MSQRIYFHRRMHIHVHCHELSTIESRALHSFPVVAARFPLEEIFRLTGSWYFGREVTGLRAQGQGWNWAGAMSEAESSYGVYTP